jgi:glucose uptake protein GlcU
MSFKKIFAVYSFTAIVGYTAGMFISAFISGVAFHNQPSAKTVLLNSAPQPTYLHVYHLKTPSS